MSMLFFPKITRTKAYMLKPCGSYFPYREYKNQIDLDCQNRCVYCDIKIEENGYEGFSLDHFRPQKLFPNLKDNPTNLVASCAKCNRSKSCHWPLGTSTSDSHDGIVGFIDPFECDRLEYFHINSDGSLIPIKGPSNYMIKLLGLNRGSRKLVRLHRMLESRIDTLLVYAESLCNEALELLETPEGKDPAIKKINHSKKIIAQIMEIKKTYPL